MSAEDFYRNKAAQDVLRAYLIWQANYRKRQQSKIDMSRCHWIGKRCRPIQRSQANDHIARSAS